MEPLRGSILGNSIDPPAVAFSYNQGLQTLKPCGLLFMVISMTYAIKH